MTPLLDQRTVREFEADQRSYGTRVALQNVCSAIAGGILVGAGAKQVEITYQEPKPRRRKAAASQRKRSRS